MSARVAILPATLAHAQALGPLLRDGDREEGLALGLDPAAAVVESLGLSEVAYALVFDGEVAAVCGVVPTRKPGTGQVWIVTGRAVDRHPKAYLRATREVLGMLLERYEELGNLIDSRYLGAVRWARWLGVEVHEPVPAGPYGIPFHPFVVRRGTWASSPAWRATSSR